MPCPVWGGCSCELQSMAPCHGKHFIFHLTEDAFEGRSLSCQWRFASCPVDENAYRREHSSRRKFSRRLSCEEIHFVIQSSSNHHPAERPHRRTSVSWIFGCVRRANCISSTAVISGCKSDSVIQRTKLLFESGRHSADCNEGY